jgi:cytochrome c biogenesis protein CcmG/thiol:disulfide interchange protein DsbE
MPERIRKLFPFGVVAILLLGIWWIAFSAVEPSTDQSTHIKAPQSGFLAPDISLRSSDGDILSLEDYRGQAVLVNLWASWCGPCRAEMPAMEKIYQDLQDQGFVVLAVNATHQDSEGAALGFIDDYNLTFPVLFDEDGRVSQAYRLQALPSSYFIDRHGIIQEVVIGGPMAEALLRTRVESLLSN